MIDKNLEKKFMLRAIELSKEAGIVKKTGGVFGAVVVKNGEIIGEGYNQVLKTNDPTWHAEVAAIRNACKNMGTPHLNGAILYTSSEPCPMCLGAAYWAQIDKIYYASTVEDALKYGNFQDFDMYQDFRLPKAERKIKAFEFLREEAVKVWQEFAQMPDKAWY